MPSAEIITIGTEILLGEIVDTNAPFIARKLRDAGIDLYRKTTVGDNAHRIAQVIQQAVQRCEIILTTGGLGPTVDDPTREAVALAVDRKIEYRPELWEQIQARFQRFGRRPTENNKRQAYVPEGSIAIENPVGTAPAFIVEHSDTGQDQQSRQLPQAIIALPGVPREMEYLLEHEVLPYLRRRYQMTGIIKARLIHTAGMGESQIDDLIGDLERQGNPTVGLAAHSGQVDVRVTAKAETEARADELIGEIETEIRARLGPWIYGIDQETLEEVALRSLQRQGWTLAVVESGLGGILTRHLTITSQSWESGSNSPFRRGEVITELPSPHELSEITASYRQTHQVEVCLGVAIYPVGERQDVHLVLVTPFGQQEFMRPFGGPPEYAPRWALHHSLDVIRNLRSTLEP